MPHTGRMRHLTTVQGSFHGHVVAARLGAEGILAELQGLSEGPYPFQGAVKVFVVEEQLDLAREVLLADAVDAAFDDDSIEPDHEVMGSSRADQLTLGTRSQSGVPEPLRLRGEDGSRGWRGRLGAMIVVALVIALVVVELVVTSR
ncbi:MAG: hypothetical protein ACYCSF_10145 [Acidimicrobiales bacterium]